jgi:cardiolipin synthase
MRDWLNLPNAVTLLRVLAAPFVSLAILRGEHALAAMIFAAAAATDSLDGFLARRYSGASAAGAYLDPIADKIFLGAVILTLAASGSLPVWFAAMVFARDFLILAFAGAALRLSPQRRFPPSVWGKLSTFLQILCVVTVLAANAAPGLAAAVEPALWLSAAGTLWSGIHYARTGAALARRRSPR